MDTLSKSLASIAKSGNIADALGTLAIEHGGTGASTAEAARSNLGLKDGALMTKSSAHVTGLAGNANEAATTEQLVQLREMATAKVYGDETSGRRVYADGFCIQWGRLFYSDIGGGPSGAATTLRLNFPVTFSRILGCLGTPDSLEEVAMSRRYLSTSGVYFSMYEFHSDFCSGHICWTAWGYV